jgi:sugar phosphate isomerase/epimerase
VIRIANLPDPQFKVGISSGIYMAGRDPQLGSIVRKLGFALTRGTNTIELAGDVPHEVDYTQGKEVRYIADKQNLTLLFHGSLTVPMTMPERGEWRDAQNHLEMSVRSAVMAGCKYVNFHACLHYWLEMMTYAGRKLSMAFVDHEGDFIGEILKDPDSSNPDEKGDIECRQKLRKWFIEKYWEIWAYDILMDEERSKIGTAHSIEGEIELRKIIRDLDQREAAGEINATQRKAEESEIRERLTKTRTEKHIELYKTAIDEKLKAGGKWDSEELRRTVTVIDGYYIMAHYLYYKNDLIWQRMADMYKGVIDRYRTVEYRRMGGEKFTYHPGGNPGKSPDYWLDAAWEYAESTNDREFKEFFYAVCAAKFMEGHMKKLLKWMEDDKRGLIAYLKDQVSDDKEKKELKEIAKNLKITIEIPDARDATYAGLYTICRIKQIYAAVKAIRDSLKDRGGEKIYMLVDFEHIATQGFDPLDETKDLAESAPDAGEYILSLHVTKPGPLHHHLQVDIGDIDVYKLLYNLRTAGLGKHHTTYLIYERGGEKDPFKQSVIAIRLMVDQLLQETKPEELVGKPEFFGMKGPALSTEERQRTIIAEHAEDPIEGLVVIPEEEYTFLSKAAKEKGAGDKWKKEELR